MKDVMIDIETLSQRPTAAIVSVGMRMFDRRTWELGPYFYERCDPARAKGNYLIDASTVRWWLQQSEAARLELAKDSESLTDVMGSLFNVIKSEWRPDCVWAMPPSFDLVILEHALRTEGLTVPWVYNAPRCVRTACDLAGISKADRVKPAEEHNALSDCDAQIATLKLAFDNLGLPPP